MRGCSSPRHRGAGEERGRAGERRPLRPQLEGPRARRDSSSREGRAGDTEHSHTGSVSPPSPGGPARGSRTVFPSALFSSRWLGDAGLQRGGKGASGCEHPTGSAPSPAPAARSPQSRWLRLADQKLRWFWSCWKGLKCLPRSRLLFLIFFTCERQEGSWGQSGESCGPPAQALASTHLPSVKLLVPLVEDGLTASPRCVPHGVLADGRALPVPGQHCGAAQSAGARRGAAPAARGTAGLLPARRARVTVFAISLVQGVPEQLLNHAELALVPRSCAGPAAGLRARGSWTVPKLGSSCCCGNRRGEGRVEGAEGAPTSLHLPGRSRPKSHCQD